MPQLEPLNLKLTGSAEGLTAALGRARGDVSAFGGQVQAIAGRFSGLGELAGGSITKMVAGFAAAAAGALSVGAAIGKIRESMNAIDEVDDASRRLGVSFNELKGLRFAVGRITGVDAGAVDAAITKMQVNLGNAARAGSGEVADALAQLGLNAQQLIEAGPIAAFQMLSDKISQVADKGTQLELINTILGKSGIAVAAALREGPDELQRLNDQMQKMSSLTDDQVARIGNANDAWEDLGQAVQGIIDRISAEFAPLFQIIAEDILGVVGNLGEADDYAKQFADTIAQVYGLFKDVLEVVTGIVDAMAKFVGGDFAGAVKAIDGALTFDGMKVAQDRMNQIRDQARASSSKGTGATDAEVQILDAQKEAALAQQAQALEAQKEAAIATKNAADSVGEKAGEVQRAVEAMKAKPLAAVTDRAEQLRRIGEIENKRTNDGNAQRMHREVIGRFDRLIDAVRNSGNLAPIDLD